MTTPPLHPELPKADLDRYLSNGYSITSNPFTVTELLDMSKPAAAATAWPYHAYMIPH